MKAIRNLCFLLAFALLSAVAFGDVHTDYDHHIDFTRFHTYSWMKVQTDDPLWQSRIKDAVNRELQAKGWQEVPSGGEVELTAVGAVHNQQEYQTFYNGMPGGWFWGGFGDTATTTVVNNPVGSLVLDMYDAQNRHLIWRGISSNTIANNPEKNEHKLDDAVKKMFEHFPPKEK